MASNDTLAPKMASTAELAVMLGVSQEFLIKQRLSNPEEHPPHVRFGRRVLYPLAGPRSLESWMGARVQGGGVA